MLMQLCRDENGVILSAEIVLVSTILVLGMIVGLVELQCGVVDELNDVGEAIGSLSQTYIISGVQSRKANGEVKAYTFGHRFVDRQDSCDGNECNIVCQIDDPGEGPKG